MSEPTTTVPDYGSIDEVLRRELAQGDAQIASIAPILRHLLANDEHSVFGDEIIARVRAMLAHIASQLLDALAEAGEEDDERNHDPVRVESLVEGLAGQGSFLTHAHALALEWQLTERLQARLALDPVVSPLMQALIASTEANVSAGAMSLLAQQARFAQSQRRMQLPLEELPADLFHAALLALRHHGELDDAAQAIAAQAEQVIRGRYDEGRSRLGLITRLVAGMGGGASAALSVTHAGAGIFLTALSMASGQDRDLAVLATNESQVARFALALRASGLKPQSIEEQFVALHPEVELPQGFDQLGADRAAAMLAHSAAYPGG
ncbi:MAG: hypothetical protein ABL914_00810 [Novosphingobium sp.]|uniref:hypothetical protein n=1 Tax=Novosphingobium sp. TaxID=1874826 RepID=UPI0032BA2738